MEPPIVFVSVEYGLAYGRAVARGVLDTARVTYGWSLSLPHPSQLLTEIERMGPAGVIVQAVDHQAVELLTRRNIPAVNVADNTADHPFPCVFSDHLDIGARAAEHLLSRGLRHFAFCGPQEDWYSNQRRLGFEKALRQSGVETSLSLLQPANQGLYYPDLLPWLAGLPRPVGVLVANDHWATVVVEGALQQHLRVPEDIAVVGVDNDELLCESALVPVSSVAIDGKRVGRVAAEILARMLAGERDIPRLTRVPPLDVVARQSTDLLAIDDGIIIDALRYIRQHVGEPITVESILDHMTISRRQLEKRFQQVLGRSPASEIRRIRVERARELIQASDRPLSEIARLSGFNDVSILGKAFRREVGLTPSEYRLRHSSRT